MIKFDYINKKIILIIVAVLAVGLAGSYFIAVSFKNNPSDTGQNQEASGQKQDINKANCLADEYLAVNGLEYPVGSLLN